MKSLANSSVVEDNRRLSLSEFQAVFFLNVLQETHEWNRREICRFSQLRHRWFLGQYSCRRLPNNAQVHVSTQCPFDGSGVIAFAIAKSSATVSAWIKPMAQEPEADKLQIYSSSSGGLG